MTREIDPVAVIRQRGVILQSAQGPAASLAELVAGGPIRGSWWAHPLSHEIYDVINRARDSATIAPTRLFKGKVTLIHRRLWAPLARLVDRLRAGALDVWEQEHADSGAHRAVSTPFPVWVPPDVMAEAQGLTEEEAAAQLPDWLRAILAPPPSSKSR